MGEAPQPGLFGGVSKVAGIAAFVQILLALVVGAGFEHFFKPWEGIQDFGTIQHRLFSPLHGVVFGQLLVFLLCVVRFFWGVYRYNDETPESDAIVHFVLGMVGAILVFGAFYLSAVYITNITLFYLGVLVVHAADVGWFLVVLSLDKGASQPMKRVTVTWIAFDFITLAVLVGGYFALGLFHHNLWVQGITLLLLFAIGAVDVWWLWPFYSDKLEWRSENPI
jgi:hypothetical protein